VSTLRDAGGLWPKRFPISFWTGASSGTKDGTFVIPPDFGGFWSGIDAAGYEIRVTNENGSSQMVFKRSAYVYADRSITLQIEDVPVTAATTKLMWVYWGQNGASRADTTPTIEAPITGVITNLRPRAPTVTFGPERVGAPNPSQSVSKAVGDVQDVWWNLAGLLSPSASDDLGSTSAEEVDRVLFAVYDADSEQAAMIDADQSAFVELLGVLYVRTRWKAGSAAGVYTLRLTVTTTTGRVAETRIVGYVTDLQE
jgi:hypothetical protein